MNMHQPLDSVIVLEFSQFLAGPSAGLRLADLGARVIKIERPKVGDACRKLALKNLFVGEDSLLFHTINRNKESFVADLKNEEDLAAIKKLIKKADVITHNFRPGVMEKIGLDYSAVQKINDKVVYAEVSGYGKEGPWKDKPGQDLLVQAVSGLTWLTGNDTEELTPFGLSVADMMCGAHLVQGILAALLLQQQTGMGSHVEVSLLESILDFQFEFLTTWLNGGGLPERGKVSNANSLLAAPYGIYQTTEGYIAIAMCDLQKFFNVIQLPTPSAFYPKDAFSKRDEIKRLIGGHLIQNSTAYWLQLLRQQEIWCMPVLNWNKLRSAPAYKTLQWQQQVITDKGLAVELTRGAVQINNTKLFSRRPAPLLGQHTHSIIKEFIPE